MKKVSFMLILVTLIWGYSWVTMKIALGDIPPFLFAGLRFLIGALFLLIILLVSKKNMKLKKQDFKHYLILGLLLGVGYSGIVLFAMQFVDSGKSSVLVYTMPIIVSILSHFFLGEKLNLPKIFSLLLAFAGLLSILGKSLLHLAFNIELGSDLLIILAAFFWASANIYTKKYTASHDPKIVTFWQLLIGGIALTIISLVTEPVQQVHFHLASFLSLMFNGIFASGIAFLIWYWVLSRIKASIASLSLMMVPILGLLFGGIQLHEKITSNILFGGALISLSIIVGSMKFSIKQKSQELDATITK